MVNKREVDDVERLIAESRDVAAEYDSEIFIPGWTGIMAAKCAVLVVMGKVPSAAIAGKPHQWECLPSLTLSDSTTCTEMSGNGVQITGAITTKQPQ